MFPHEQVKLRLQLLLGRQHADIEVPALRQKGENRSRFLAGDARISIEKLGDLLADGRRRIR